MSVKEISEQNRNVYRGLFTTRSYQKDQQLKTPEAAILSRIGAQFTGRRILDIGVGGGRTTTHLLAISKDYIGIDYSPRMISLCKARFPDVRFEVCDARNLTRFSDGSFDFAMFSFCGIDYIAHMDRLQALKEIRRVLAPGGAFVFSSHNREFTQAKSPWSWTNSPLSVNPLADPGRFLRRFGGYPIGIAKHAINRRKQQRTSDYEIRNDEVHNYSLLTYYISMESQIRQLENLGFGNVETVGVDGRWLSREGTERNEKDHWLNYVCRCL